MIERIASMVSWRAREVVSKFKRQIKRNARKIVTLDQARILDALKGFGAFQADILLVHSSLSACGYIRGGPRILVEALLSWISDRVLAMPTHTYCYPDETGKTPIFEVNATPSRVGAITEYFWRQPSAIRSVHPTHSLACCGSTAEELCQGHELCNTPCGVGTPYEKLVKNDCSVILFGARRYTLFHTAEDAAKVPYLYESSPYSLLVRNREGIVRTVVMWRQDMSVIRRFASIYTWLEERGLLIKRRFGLGELQFIPHAGEVHDSLVKELTANPLFLVAESARPDVAKRYRL